MTRGELEGQHFGQPRNVIYQATEDDYAVIVNGRLEAAGADLTRVFVIGGQEGEGFPRLPRDAARVRELADEHEPALIVFDPISDAFAEGLDDNKELDVRKALNPLTALGRDLDLTVIGIKHFRKGLDGHSQDLMSGSGAWTQVPRTVLHVTPDPEDEEGNARLLYINKTNYGKKGNPLRFVISGIAQDIDGELDETTKVEWVGESKLNPDDVLPMLREQQDSRATETALGEASVYVLELLEDAGGSLPKGEVVNATENEGIKSATLKRVPKAAGIEIRKDNANKRNTVWIHPNYLERYEENKAQLEQRSAANRARYASQTAHVSSPLEDETNTKVSSGKSQDPEAVRRETVETYLEQQQLEIGHDYRDKEVS